ncbi:MAG TPA: PaaX family transcriptional regulator C-terminal domain-containing protein [Pseudonocardia sp.]
MTAGAQSDAGPQDGRPSPLIITLFGMYARAQDNWLSIAAVVALMADLGVDPQAVRSSIFRLKRRGVLVSERRGSVAGYALAAEALELLAEGDVRIFEHHRGTTDDGWAVVVFSVPEAERQKRHELRAVLTNLGFGTATAGVWVAPGHLSAAACRALHRQGLSAYVDIFTGRHLAFGDLSGKVREWWNLTELTSLYGEFLDRHSGLARRALAHPLLPLDAFRTYVPMLTAWRRLPYRDPGIPLTLLPPGWNGVAAGELFDALHRALRPPVDKHVLSVIHG